MKYEEIIQKQTNLNLKIQDLSLKESDNTITEFERGYLYSLRKEYGELTSMLPAAEGEKVLDEYGKEYYSLWSEKKEIENKKGIKGGEDAEKLNEVNRKMAEIVDKNKNL